MSRTARIDTLNESQFIAQQFHKTPQVDPSKTTRERQTKVHDLDMIETYSKINKPILSKEKRDAIEQTLQLQKKAKKNTKSRIKGNNYFLNYDYNPFSEKENTRINRKKSEMKLKPSYSFTKLNKALNEPKQEHIIDALRNIKNNNFKRNNEQIMQTKLSTIALSSKINKNARNLHYNFSPILKQTNPLVAKPETEITFEQIIAIPEKNYYEQNQGEINIFQFMFGNHRKILNSQILHKYYFSFASNVQKLSKFKIPSSRDLSKLARTLSIDRNVPKNVRLQALNSSELSFKANDIRFIDLISVASGRINSPMAYSILFQDNAQRETSPNSSHFGESAISYEENKKQQLINFNNKQSFRQENIDYLRLENTAEEAKYEHRYKKVYNNVKINADEGLKVLSQTIKDKKLHTNYHRLINQDVEFLNILDNRNQPQTEKFIRTNKRKKNRQQRLKIHTLLSTLQLKNQYHQKIQEIIKQKSAKK